MPWLVPVSTFLTRLITAPVTLRVTENHYRQFRNLVKRNLEKTYDRSWNPGSFKGPGATLAGRTSRHFSRHTRPAYFSRRLRRMIAGMPSGSGEASRAR